MEKLKDSERIDVINYRLSRSHETLKAADILIESGDLYSAVNRLYYACYYALSALLIKHELPTKTHNGVKTQFGEHFIMKKVIDRRHGVFYSQIFNSRHEGDYDDFVFFDLQTVTQYREKTAEFLQMIKEQIEMI